MSLLLATGSNLGNRETNLESALEALKIEFILKAKSRVYVSKAIEYESQPDFLNQVLEFELPKIKPEEILKKCLSIEKKLGRVREIDKGPRSVDIDILFYGLTNVNLPNLTIPHPRLFERSFVVLPLQELPYYSILNKSFSFPKQFNNSAKPFL